MLDAITVLQQEHRKIGKVLGLLRQQATNLSLGGNANHRLLDRAFEYLSGYPDQCHHPKEDVLYRKLVSRFPDSAQSLKNLVEEHEKLAAMTRDLHQVIDGADSSALNEALADRLRAFLDFYHDHMLTEEQRFFPLALHRLSRNDFAEIDFTLFDDPDSALNREAEKKYADLSDEIAQLGIAEKARAGEREESALLATLVDIAAFNETMDKMGEPINLVRSSGGGYELARKENVLVRIPACSEARAAWCAYFFWKAATRVNRI